MPPKDESMPRDFDEKFKETLARFIRVDPKEVINAVTSDLLKQREDARRRIEAVRRELEDGARPRRGRFRL
jgi:hypothetical protein